MTAYLLKVPLRDYKRLVLLVVSVGLAVSLFVGSTIGLDSVGRKVLEEKLEEVYVDYTVVQHKDVSKWADVKDKLLSLEHVTGVETVIAFEARTVIQKDRNFTSVFVRGVGPEFDDRFNVTILEGVWNLSEGVVISEGLADGMDLSVGDNVTISVLGAFYIPEEEPREVWMSKELRIVGVCRLGEDAVEALGEPYEVRTYGSIVQPIWDSYVIMSIDDCLDLAEEFLSDVGIEEYEVLSARHSVFIDREAVVNLWNVDATLKNLDELRTNIWLAVEAYDAEVEDHLSWPIQDYVSWYNGMKNVFGALSLPVYLVCWFLASVSGRLMATDKRREIGLLKVRGASSRSVFATYMLTSLVMGLAGGGLGIVLGLFSGAAVESMLLKEATFVVSPKALRPETVYTGLGIGCAVALLSFIMPSRMASRVSPMEATMEYIPEEVRVRGPSKWAVVALVLGGYKVAEWIAGLNPMELVAHIPVRNFLLMIVISVLLFLDVFILNFVGPFLFIYGATKVLTESETKFYTAISTLMRGFLREMSELVSRNLSRRPKIVAGIAFIIALTIAFGVTTTMASAGIRDYQVRNARITVGSDIQAVAPATLGIGYADNISAVEGVAEVSPMVKAEWVEWSYAGHYTHGHVYAVDLDTFLDVAYLDPGLAKGGSLRGLLEKMRGDESSVLVSLHVYKEMGIRPGQTVTITFVNPEDPSESVEATFNVVGVVKGFPGTSLMRDEDALIIRLDRYNETLRDLYEPPWMKLSFLVKVEDGYDVKKVADTLREDENLHYVESFEEQVEDITKNPTATAVLTFLDFEYAYTVVAATAGLAVSSILNIHARVYEIGVLRARGASRRQFLRALFGESLAIIVVSTLIGLLTGVATAKGILNLFAWLSPIRPRLLATPKLAYLVLGALASLVASTLVPAWLYARKTVVETVRFR